jgi:chromosomal replication initiation ATPase DnaA
VRDKLGFSYTTLSNLIGYKNHTAVIHAVKIVQEELKNSPALCRTVRNILECVDKIQAEAEEDQSSSL